MSKQRICVDMDEVLADSIARFQEWYGRDFQLELTLAALRGKHPHEIVAPEHQPALRAYPNAPGFFRDLPLMADSQRVMQELAGRYELFIASAAMEFANSFLDKYEWLQRHFPFIPWRNYVFCGDKSILNADYLIDDNAYNFDNFRGEGILFDAPHNALETRYRRAHGWQAVGEMLL
ncbi:MAG: 5' nucleotidase, NT5C type [Janthinobacterium lividum]